MSKFGDIAEYDRDDPRDHGLPVMVIADPPGKSPIVFWMPRDPEIGGEKEVINWWPQDAWDNWKVISPVEDVE
jgi:hypothetical protein